MYTAFYRPSVSPSQCQQTIIIVACKNTHTSLQPRLKACMLTLFWCDRKNPKCGHGGECVRCFYPRPGCVSVKVLAKTSNTNLSLAALKHPNGWCVCVCVHVPVCVCVCAFLCVCVCWGNGLRWLVAWLPTFRSIREIYSFDDTREDQ